MTTNPRLTPAAERDLAAMRRGERVDLRFGPYSQLIAAGLIEGPQDAPRLVGEATPTSGAVEYALMVDWEDGEPAEYVPAVDMAHATTLARTIYADRPCRVVGREVNPWRYVILTPASKLGDEVTR